MNNSVLHCDDRVCWVGYFNEGNVLVWIPKGKRLRQTSKHAFRNVITRSPRGNNTGMFLAKMKPASKKANKNSTVVRVC